ncbi:putative Stromal cell-derived factor 2 [Blattamonas nauphoetae]|uniref:Stromal cell-derived factor 2 n=1 Tax=Blattamonas nauphoetae TaxID=2049346 RepID=A0ABQ9X795_9EUKA|nr:putative Stromal cell-derived factor 2 [Blattamonas nauphoetae]
MLTILTLLASSFLCQGEEPPLEEEDDFSPVTYGSNIRLMNVHTRHRLHSHEIPYGQGSFGQSVTAYPSGEDPNSMWYLKAAHGKHEKRGTPIKCGDIIRLEHIKTRKNLHSDNFQSPASKQQEVSAFGENGVGNELDDWKVICEPGKHKHEIWGRGLPVMFQHVHTQKYLFTHKGFTFNAPLQNQQEVTCFDKFDDPENKWKTAEGVYFKPPRVE